MKTRITALAALAVSTMLLAILAITSISCQEKDALPQRTCSQPAIEAPTTTEGPAVSQEQTALDEAKRPEAAEAQEGLRLQPLPHAPKKAKPQMETREYDISDLVEAANADSRTGEMKGDSGMRDVDGDGGMMGGMGGMGGYRAGVQYNWQGAVAPRAPAAERLRLQIELASVTEDEIWVICREKAPQATGSEYETPGSGAMMVVKGTEKVPLPLKHTDVKGRVCGYIATVEVTQQFQNPFSEKIEAVYVFPLPENAAVNEFIMVIGERKIRGIIRERQEAEEIYREARAQGHVASLLTQERPNIFTQKVANIEPGKQIDVNIKYFNTLAYADGWYEFVFPMVVGPRFNPAGSTAGIGAVGRGARDVSGQSTEVQYLKPNERSGHDISLAVEIDAGVEIEEVACASHAIRKDSDGSEKVRVQLSDLDNIPNKDFVLRFKVAGDTVKSALVTHRDQRGGFFTLMLYPPEDLKQLKRAPMEMVFVLDCSGSMNGQPIAKAKDAIKRALRKLEPDDTFQVIRFSENASQLGSKPVAATAENVRRGIEFVDKLQGEGGTMMIEGIKAALDFPHDPRRFRLVSFMTDGFIGNEAEILGEIHQRLGSARIFSFGVGTSVNRYLLDRMAKLGKGAVAYIGLNDNSSEVVDLFYDRISHPALTDVRIDWGDMEVSEVYPRQIPDLFVGRPIVVTGRFNGQKESAIRVAGRVGEHEKEIRVAMKTAAHPGIACVWARKRIEDLATQATYNASSTLPTQIKQVALEYGLMSAYTAFVAVDSTQTTAGDHGVTVAVPVPVPEGVRYDTTVQD